jgi:hypothetical protein
MKTIGTVEPEVGPATVPRAEKVTKSMLRNFSEMFREVAGIGCMAPDGVAYVAVAEVVTAKACSNAPAAVVVVGCASDVGGRRTVAVATATTKAQRSIQPPSAWRPIQVRTLR